eukprot:TRINITY_DN779_c0_g1_i2.p1 TRINITY_DN779_c0_g1~~TRINITY_DN779_c0_g1_i2.p1  ORF type:complete len:251 (+),score=33.96 TRINITY_DN779_c0_g1_i2:201-953(+)
MKMNANSVRHLRQLEYLEKISLSQPNFCLWVFRFLLSMIEFSTFFFRNSDHGYEKAKKASHDCLKRLGMDYVDLLLIHHPDAGGRTKEENNRLRLETWRAMEEFLEQGKAKAIGVSNYTINHLEALLPHCKHIPAVNQVELHPLLTQTDLHDYCKKHNIQLEAYSSLGKGKLVSNKVVTEMASKYNKSPSQLLLRYGIERDIVVIPKSSNADRMKENISIFDFQISNADMTTLNSLNSNWHCTWDPTDTL